MILLFIGPSASGKDTQAKLLSDKFGFELVSTGQLLRDISSGRTPIQRAIAAKMNEGFMDDDIVFSLLRLLLSRKKQEHFILSGVVRWATQVELLDKALRDLHKSLHKAIYFELSDEEVMKRVSGRRECSICHTNYHTGYNPPMSENMCDECGGELIQRKDDTPEGIQNRLIDFHKENNIILNEYRERDILHTVDASQSIERIFELLVEELQLESLFCRK